MMDDKKTAPVRIEEKFVVPEMLDPVYVYPTGQERRRERRKKERVKQAKKKK